MKVVVLQSNYLPWRGYFNLIDEADVFCFYDEVKYTKNDWRNRNQIVGPNGLFWLTVPIASSATNSKISEAEPIGCDWQKKHLISILQAYSKSPFINEWKDFFEETYLNRTWASLSCLNQYLIKEISKRIGITTEFANSADYHLEDGRIERLKSLLKQLGCSKYISGPSAKDYMEDYLQEFMDANIQVEFFSYPTYKEYNHFRGITPPKNCSILDIIFNVGQTNALSFIR